MILQVVLNMMVIKDLASMVYKLFNSKIAPKTVSGKGLKESNKIAYSQFKDDIWGVDLADMQSLSKKNKSIKYLLSTIDLFGNICIYCSIKR